MTGNRRGRIWGGVGVNDRNKHKNDRNRFGSERTLL